MTLRKILLYGGCHALILRDLLAAHFSDCVEADLLINFELIRTQEPFPYETLGRYDAVVFSPIENKQSYNTAHLIEACTDCGVEAMSFPWLEWHGYCPGAAKGDFKHRYQWRFPSLIEAASRFERFELFYDWAIESFPADASIDACFIETTAMLRGAEQRHAMPIRVSDYILERHRERRLFLISDHPSIALYAHVLRQVVSLLGIPHAQACDRLERSFDEPQGRWRTPIFPRVAERLGLGFRDPYWVDDEVVPSRTFDLRSYLRLYFHRASVILGPAAGLALSPIVLDGRTRSVGPSTRLVADQTDTAAAPHRGEYQLVEVLSGDATHLAAEQCFEIDHRQWRTTWG